jgi:Protein of unknown function (DUF3570)
MSVKNKPNCGTAALEALMATAIVLPGLLEPSAQAAEDDEVDFQYSHYQEGKRNLFGSVSGYNPIEVESLHGSAKVMLTDRIKLAFNYTQDTWGGATPVATAPIAFGGFHDLNEDRENPDAQTGATPYLQPSGVFFDKHLNAYKQSDKLDGLGNFLGYRYIWGNQLVHTLSMASQEVRMQSDFKLSYEWDEAALTVGGGISVEDDYESRFGSIQARWDFNQKQTTLNAGLNYTHSDIHSILDHDAWPYFHQSEEYDNRTIQEENGSTHVINGTKQDWSVQLGVSQILNKNAVLETSMAYTRSTGYMENPYKAVYVGFIDPTQQDPNLSCPAETEGLLCASINSLMEQRPDERNQWSGGMRYVQHIEAADAAMHLGYRVFSDDWGITSHTFDADWVQPLGQGWTVTPRIYYYSQDAADFYTPYLISNQGFLNNIVDNKGRQVMVDNNFDPEQSPLYFYNPVTGQYFDTQDNDVTEQYNNGDLSLSNKQELFDRKKLPKNFSSDHRLSGFGTLSGGITLTKQFAKGISLDLDFEYYTHQGGLKIGGDGEGNYADFDFWTANAALKLDLAALSIGSNNPHPDHHSHHHGGNVPAGVMFGHTLAKAGDMMVGYRYQWSSQSGDMLNGVGSAQIV